MTPLHLTMLLHYHAICEPYSIRDLDHRYSSAVCEYRTDLFDWGLIVPIIVNDDESVVEDKARMARLIKNKSLLRFDHGLFSTTDRGKKFVKTLCNVGGAFPREPVNTSAVYATLTRMEGTLERLEKSQGSREHLLSLYHHPDRSSNQFTSANLTANDLRVAIEALSHEFLEALRNEQE